MYTGFTKNHLAWVYLTTNVTTFYSPLQYYMDLVTWQVDTDPPETIYSLFELLSAIFMHMKLFLMWAYVEYSIGLVCIRVAVLKDRSSQDVLWKSRTMKVKLIEEKMPCFYYSENTLPRFHSKFFYKINILLIGFSTIFVRHNF